MRKNTLKQKLNDGKATLGAFVNFPSPAMVETLGWLGMDFVIIDCEHGIMDYESAENMIRAAELSDTTPIVRVGLNHPQHIQRYMDGGAAGVLMPFTNDGTQAKAVVDAVKYPPVGKRGFFGGRGARYGIQPIAEYVKEANVETFVGLQIESLEGIANQDAIINTPGADLIFLGPGDLSSVFGVPGQITNPKVMETIETLARKIRAAGKHVGTIAMNGEHAAHWRNRGINWLVTSTNRLFSVGARSYLEECRKSLAIKG
ncbi:MAG: aldolase [Chloroflexi bacterium]|nr:aldolase [Chloroflexota bacterium]